MRAPIVLALAAALLGTAPAPSPQALDGIALGSNVRELFDSYGTPDVATTDVGQIWMWKRKDGSFLRITTDDDGNVRIVDINDKAEVTVGLTGTAYASRLSFGADRANNALTPPTEYEHVLKGTFPDSGAPAEYWEYPFAPRRELVLAYDIARAPDGPLREIFFGNRDPLALAGLLPDAPANAYKAPVLIELGSADYAVAKQGTAFTRIEISPDGSVTSATIFASSGSSELDTIALAVARGCSFEPALRNGVAVPSVYFRREDFVIANH
jgi:TonB family protein